MNLTRIKKNKLLTAACVAASLALTSTSVLADMAKVAVSQIVEHPALDAARQGLLDGLKEKGYVEGQNLEFTYQTAQGKPSDCGSDRQAVRRRTA